MDSQALYRTAEQCLLAPYDLTPRQLESVFGQVFGHRVDYADLYFQYGRSEAWSLEEGIVKSGSFNIDQGVGVRAIAGEKTAFAYSDEISLPALKSAARAVRAIAASGSHRLAPMLGPRARAGALRCRTTPSPRSTTPPEGAVARAAGRLRPRRRPARDRGHGAHRRHVGSGAGGALRRPSRRRRAAAGARLDHGHHEGWHSASRAPPAAAAASTTAISATRCSRTTPPRPCIRPASISPRGPRRPAP